MWYVLVADDSFLLREYVMKPFSQEVAIPARKIFNCRLPIARRMTVFSYTTLLWRVAPVTISCVQRYHISTPHRSEEIESGNVTPGPRCNESMSLSKTACHPTNSAELVRESFVRYFNNEGQVSLAKKSYSLPIFTRVYSKTERWHIAGSACRQFHTPEGFSTGQQSMRFTCRPPHARQFCLSGRSEGGTVRVWWV
ncbi:hypothetical protein PR048_025228 [Dryococelus australis]|uniref:Uncharacterized protein n=1 Tax=Dryococelus australis TaxID=614101 RepID=A0ABQ9GQU0_9NEOP|nr:hypothetical protein PR048_025228 [Dryococelus australis]